VLADEDEPNILIFNSIHANELIPAELALETATTLLEGYGRDPDITTLVNNKQIYVIVYGNPDGVHHMWYVDNLWRKNRRPNDDGSFGVDMNRNYPFGFDFDFCKGSDNTSEFNYRGPSAASEPEVQTIMALQSDRNFERVFDFHSGCGPDVRHNYARDFMLPKAIDDMGISIANELASAMEIGMERALACGTQPSFAYWHRGSLSFLTELSLPDQPDAVEKDRVLQRSMPGVLEFLRRPTSVSGHIVDSITRRGISASLSLPDLKFSYNETKVSTPFTGRFFLWLPDGTYRLSIFAEGYGTQPVPVTADSTTTEEVSIAISPQSCPQHLATLSCESACSAPPVANAGVDAAAICLEACFRLCVPQ
jgi:hypothetical protein